MSELEERIRRRDTQDLQRALHRNELIPEAIEIAKTVLAERGAVIPESLTEDEMSEERHARIKQSYSKLFIFLLTIGGWYVYARYNHLFDAAHSEELEKSIKYFGLFLLIELGLFKL